MGPASAERQMPLRGQEYMQQVMGTAATTRHVTAASL